MNKARATFQLIECGLELARTHSESAGGQAFLAQYTKLATWTDQRVKRNCANPENVLLTCREREVAALRIGGMKIRVIASRLSIAEATVKAHLKNGRHKTGGR
jgi:DNA-binding NarL/FixJ family response regulator